MSPDAYAQMSLDELIAEYVRLAMSLGSLWSRQCKPEEKTPERVQMRGELGAIGAELRVRKPIERLRALFDHENVDVRFHAAWAFLEVDPDWASAAISGLGEGLAAKDVIALRARAKKRPPARPSLKDMSTDQLVARFEDAGVRRYATQFLGGETEPFDVELNNRIAVETGEIVDELATRDALSRLLALLDHPNISVRRTAATFAISVAPDRTLPVLEAVSASRDLIEAPRASATLDRWNDSKKRGSASKS